MYSGYAACAAVLGVRWLREGSLPDGYGLSLATLYGCYILSLKLVYGTWWEVHTLTGIVVVAGLTGWLVSFLMRRPLAASPAT